MNMTSPNLHTNVGYILKSVVGVTASPNQEFYQTNNPELDWKKKGTLRPEQHWVYEDTNDGQFSYF